MLETKTFEIRDKGTFIPVMATAMRAYGKHTLGNDQDAYLLRRAGYGPDQLLVALTHLQVNEGNPISFEPESWRHRYWRTITAAHAHITANWDTLASGQVIDVEFILGETHKPKVSERYE